MLSPFEVNTSRDVGYTATSALAGGRTDMELKNTPSAVSVITREFIDDIAADSLHSISEWAVNSVPFGDRNETFTSPYSLNIRGLGMSEGGRTSRNYFVSYVNTDNYNTERIEFARGPNGVLFGDGDPGGISTTFTKRPRFGSNSYSLQLRGNSEGSYRSSIDINQTYNQVFGLRLNALYDRNETWRDNTDGERKGVHLAAAYRVTPRNNIRAEAEYGLIRAPFFTTNYDEQASYWDRTTIYSGTGTLQTAGTGLQRIAATPYFVYIPGNPGAGYSNWANSYTTLGSGIAIQPARRDDITNFPVLPRREFNLSPPETINRFEYQTYSAYVDHRFSKNFFVELAYNYTENLRTPETQRTLATEYRIDVNRSMPNGQPNPKFGVPYSDIERGLSHNQNKITEIRLLAAYQHDLKWLKQRVNFIGGSRLDRRHGGQSRLRRINGPNINQNAPENVHRVRLYWDEPGAHSWGPTPKISDYDFSEPGSYYVGELPGAPGYEFAFLDTSFNQQEWGVNYAQIAAATQLFDERLTLHFGGRYDAVKVTDQTTAGVPTEPGTNRPQLGAVVRGSDGRRIGVPGAKGVFDAQPFSRNGGFVYFMRPWLGLYANYSETFEITGPGFQRITGETPGIARSDGLDVGLKLQLFDGKISGTAGYYSTEIAGRVVGGAQVPQINRIWTNLGRVDLADVSHRDTQDFEADGYELDFTANPTRNLRMIFNLAFPSAKAVNLRPDLRAYVAANLAEWQAGAANPANPARQQIQIDIDAIQGALSGLTPGTVLGNTVKYTANIYATYTFRNEGLKGFGLGGGVNFRGKTKIGNTLASAYDYLYSDPYELVSTHVSYTRKIGKVNARLQLNVSNLFDNDDLVFTSYQNYRTGGLASQPLNRIPGDFTYLAPRRFVLTATFGF